ncbi:hypothetical protein Egran_00930 [Elaphomyces granulatus]|uniref:Integral membrane protein n=1 Tax=Elaphomyces granulatus TaxID=519963 RepID=A0A232M4P9_9EURO|nr:hypothetical protein Egran_00930 [Elaphomyces granulatus]
MTSRVPVDYQLPAFPSLYNPVNDHVGGASYLYYKKDIWRFTLLWTLILYAGVFLAVVICAVLVQWRNWRIIWAVPLGYCITAGLEGLLAGSVVGLILGAVYEAGNVTMSTWTPFLWASINVLVVILSSFPMQGAI